MHRLLFLTLLVAAAPASGQQFPDQNGSALAGVTEFDARVFVLAWLDVDEDRARFRDNATDAFILALRRDGIRVEPAAPNYLICEITAAQPTEAIVVFNWDIAYYAYNPDGIHLLLWNDGGIAARGTNVFTAEDAAKLCGDAVASEWLRWNP